jgi:AraC-like DNA-binding protein
MSAPPLRVARHDSPLGRWEMTARDALPAHGPHVLRYVGYRESSPGPFRRVEVPTGDVHVIISFGPEIRTPAPSRSFVAAPHDEHAVTEHDGEQHGLELQLTPLGTRMLLGVPMHELAGLVVPLEDLLGREADELAERLVEAPGWEARFALLDDVIARRLDAAAPLDGAVEHAWRRLVVSHGDVPVAALARDVGFSRRHLLHRFRDHVGLGPKVFARILRFRRATRLLLRPGGPSLSEVALGCGYFDQAHLNRDFRAFAGCTPTELLARRLPDEGGFTAGG